MHVVITGANRGIGRALFDSYTARGDEVTGTCRKSPPTDGHWIQLDVTAVDAGQVLGSALDAQPVDLLICNAGVYLDKGEGLADGYPPQMWADSFATNVTGVFQTVQALLPNLQMSDASKIAIISSQMASHERAPGGSYIYRASKAAVLNVGRNLAVDLEPIGISVGIYHPGWVQTDMGGASAAITVDEAAKGLVERFDTLSPKTSGVFETWDGQPHPY